MNGLAADRRSRAAPRGMAAAPRSVRRVPRRTACRPTVVRARGRRVGGPPVVTVWGAVMPASRARRTLPRPASSTTLRPRGRAPRRSPARDGRGRPVRRRAAQERPAGRPLFARGARRVGRSADRTGGGHASRQTVRRTAAACPAHLHRRRPGARPPGTSRRVGARSPGHHRAQRGCAAVVPGSRAPMAVRPRRRRCGGPARPFDTRPPRAPAGRYGAARAFPVRTADARIRKETPAHRLPRHSGRWDRARDSVCRDCDSSLRRARATCCSTVRGDRCSVAAISRFVSPVAARSATSCSRGDNWSP